MHVGFEGNKSNVIAFNEPQQTGPDCWVLSWTSDQVDPEFRVYLDGVLVSTQTSTEYQLRSEYGQLVIVEVLDVAADVPSDAFPANMIQGWRRDSDAALYVIEEYVSAVWTERARIVPDEALDWLAYATGALTDETVAIWRVTPYDAAGNAGTAVSFSALMVRHPDVPNVEFTYNGAGTPTVTIAAA